MKKQLALLLSLAWAGCQAAGPTPHQQDILNQFTELLKIPNIASDHDGIRRNAEAITAMMRPLDLNPRLLTPASTATGRPTQRCVWRVS